MKKLAFTLAEVLITLTIIGVIAALTIPTLMKKYEDAQTVAGVKEAYAILGNAFKMAIRENGPVTEWNWPTIERFQSSKNGSFVASMLIPYLKVQKYCGSFNVAYKDRPSCLSYAEQAENGHFYNKYLNGSRDTTVLLNLGGATVLSNGMTLLFSVHSPRGAVYYTGQTYAQNYIGSIWVDINGKKGPNQDGIDVFIFGYDDNGVAIIRGLTDTNYTPIYNKNNCSNKSSTGTSCATWILLHNNVDYKYRDVSKEW